MKRDLGNDGSVARATLADRASCCVFRRSVRFREVGALIAAVSASLLLGASGSLASPTSPDPKLGHASGWFLIALEEPLSVAGPRQMLPITTGSPQLDMELRAAGIDRIEHALPWAVVEGSRPERLAALGLDRTYKLFVPEGSDIPSLIARFKGLPGVRWAEPDYVGSGASTFPNDTLFSTQYGHHNTGQTGGLADADIDSPEAWDITKGSSRVIIAVLDSGADSDHEDFAGKLVAGYDFVNVDPDPEDDHGHGSNTASIAAAATNNGRGIAGTCWNCKIMPVKNLDSTNFGFYSWWADSLIFAADNGARVINMSEGGTGDSFLLHGAIIYAYEAGCIIAAAMMNGNSATPYFPATWAETIAVGATNHVDQRAAPFCWGGGSSYGPHNDVVAPGDLITGVAMGGGYSQWCGTSQATPAVSGLVGLMETVYPSLGREEANHLLRAGSDDRVGRPTEDVVGFDFYHGWGRVNAQRTLAGTVATISQRVTGPAATRVFHATANPIATSFDFIRGNLSALTETTAGVSLGAVVCIENDSADADTAGLEDLGVPAPGSGFFYLSRFKARNGKGSYGGSSRNRDRVPTSGDCAP